MLTYASPEEVKSQLDEFAALSKRIEEVIIEICFHMNGGVTWDEAWGMCALHRYALIEYINKMNSEGNTQELM